jgi:Flp pilus assembly protein protease CpaA
MLELITYLIFLIFVNFILIYSSISDVRNRKISNKVLKIFFLFSLGLVFIESLNYLEEILFFVMIKSSFFFFHFYFLLYYSR